MASDPKKLQSDYESRLADARQMKNKHDRDIREGYFFTAPRKSRQVSSVVDGSSVRPSDEGELQISIAIEEAETFATTIISSFMPAGVPWVDAKPSSSVPEVLKDEVQDKLVKQRDAAFDLITESNFYSELGTALNPDAAIGTFALWIDRGKYHQPVSCRAVPLRELDINVGPDGKIDDRFVTRHTRYGKLRSVLGPGIKLPKKIETMAARDPKGKTRVTWGMWRLWDVEDRVSWQYVISVDDDVVFDKRLDGWGSCPLIVVTFNRHVEFAFGEGPTIKSLPELRVLDDMAAGEVENVDVSLRPPMGFPDDSFANLSDGIVPGNWYPIRPGSENAVRKLIDPNPMDAVYFTQKAREERVRRLHYNDFPQQRGDTPPTATQWIDEMAMAQRKIGTPGLRFWDEGPCEIFMRFLYLAREAGTPGVDWSISTGDREISLLPDNPTKRAQESQDVALITRACQIGASLFPEEFKAVYDGTKIMDEVNKKLRVDQYMQKRSKEDLNAAVNMISKMAPAGGNVGGMMPGAPQGMPQG